jgi:tRNA G46 methylase TrmB
MKKIFFQNEKPIVIDLFAGSGNLLYHVAKAVDAKTSIGFEKDFNVCCTTTDNYKTLNFDCALYNKEYVGVQDLDELH